MPVEFEKKVCFIHIPKTGGTTIVKTLQAIGLMNWSVTGVFQKNYSYGLPGSLDQISWYDPMYHPGQTRQLQHLTLNDIKVLCNSDFSDWEMFTIVRNPWDRLVSIFEYGKQTGGRAGTLGLSFSDWVRQRTICNLQYPYINADGPNQMINFPSNLNLYHFPDLQRCIKDVCEMFSYPVPAALYHEKRTSRAGYRSYYTEETKEIVAQEAQVDINHFGFKF